MEKDIPKLNKKLKPWNPKQQDWSASTNVNTFEGPEQMKNLDLSNIRNQDFNSLQFPPQFEYGDSKKVNTFQEPNQLNRSYQQMYQNQDIDDEEENYQPSSYDVPPYSNEQTEGGSKKGLSLEDLEELILEFKNQNSQPNYHQHVQHQPIHQQPEPEPEDKPLASIHELEHQLNVLKSQYFSQKPQQEELRDNPKTPSYHDLQQQYNNYQQSQNYENYKHSNNPNKFGQQVHYRELQNHLKNYQNQNPNSLRAQKQEQKEFHQQNNFFDIEQQLKEIQKQNYNSYKDTKKYNSGHNYPGNNYHGNKGNSNHGNSYQGLNQQFSGHNAPKQVQNSYKNHQVYSVEDFTKHLQSLKNHKHKKQPAMTGHEFDTKKPTAFEELNAQLLSQSFSKIFKNQYPNYNFPSFDNSGPTNQQINHSLKVNTFEEFNAPKHKNPKYNTLKNHNYGGY